MSDDEIAARVQGVVGCMKPPRSVKPGYPHPLGLVFHHPLQGDTTFRLAVKSGALRIAKMYIFQTRMHFLNARFGLRFWDNWIIFAIWTNLTNAPSARLNTSLSPSHGMRSGTYENPFVRSKSSRIQVSRALAAGKFDLVALQGKVSCGQGQKKDDVVEKEPPKPQNFAAAIDEVDPSVIGDQVGEAKSPPKKKVCIAESRCTTSRPARYREVTDLLGCDALGTFDSVLDVEKMSRKVGAVSGLRFGL